MMEKSLIEIMKREINNILFLGAHPFIGNRGVGALAFGTLKIIFNNLPNAKVKFLEYSKVRSSFEYLENNQIFNIDLINMRFSKKFYLRNNILMLLTGAFLLRVIPMKIVRDIVFFYLPCLKEIDEADFAVSISGGDSFSDIYGIQRYFYYSLPQILMILLQKRLILLPQTLGPFNTKLCRLITKYILLNAEKVYTRDFISQIEVKRLFKNKRIDNKLEFCFDVGFLLDSKIPRYSLDKIDSIKINYSRPLIGLNISGLLYKGGYTKDDQFKIGLDYPKFIKELIDWLILGKNINILLVPHVFGTQLESDSNACREIYGGLKEKYKNRIFFIDEDFNQSEIKYVIGNCDLFIGSRMHACIAALSQGIPAIALSYSKKFYGLFQTIGFERLVIDLRKININEAYNIISKTFDDREKISQELECKVTEVKDKLIGLLKPLRLLQK